MCKIALRQQSKIFGVCIEKGNSHLELKFLIAPRSLKALVSSILWMREHKESSNDPIDPRKKRKETLLYIIHITSIIVVV